MTKFCKDCKWAKRPWLEFDYQYARCTNPETERALSKDTDYLVSGKRKNFFFCSSQRDFGKCGPEGKLWEKRQ